MRVTLALLALLTVAGCASRSGYDLDISMSELSAAIEDGAERIDIPAAINFDALIETNIAVSSTYNAHTDWPGFANNRLTLSSRQVFDLNDPNYTLGRGYEIAFAGDDDIYQLRLGLYYNPARFYAGQFDGFNNPVLLGLDIDGHAIVDLERVEFVYGVRVTTALLGYEFDRPVAILGQQFYSDSLGILGLGSPVGFKVALGNWVFETLFAPMIYFYYAETSLGVDNDLVRWNWNAPLTLGVGYQW